MSGAQTSTFGEPNILLQTLSGAQTAAVQRNQLLNQLGQQEVAANNTEVVARAASALIDPSLYPTEEARAAAWPGIIKRLKADGYAPNAPDYYPGLQHLQMTARLGTPSADLFKLQQNQAGWGQITGDGTGTTGTGGGGAATGGGTTAAAPATSSGPVEPDALARAQAVRDGLIKRGLDVDTATAFAANSLHESSANPNTGPGDAGASHGLFQWRADRYDRYKSVFGNAPDNAPLDQQLDYVVHELGTTEGAARDRIAAAQGPAAKAAAISQYYLRPKDVQPEMARRSGTAAQLATQWGGAGTSSTAPVVAGDSIASKGGLGGSGVVGASPAAVLASVRADSRAGKYSGQPVVLSTGASNNPADLDSVEQQIREAQGGNAGKITVLGVGPAVEAKAPGTNAKLAALSKAYGADFVPLPADQMSPDGVHPTAQGYATLKAAIAPPQGASGGVAARTGGTDVAGPGAGPGGAPGADLVGPRVLPSIGPGSPVVTPQSLANTPTPQQQPQVPQPPTNRVMPGGTDGPPAPAVAQQQPPAPVQPAARPAAPAAGGLFAGLSPDQVQAVRALQRSNGTPAQGLAMIEHFKEVNATAAHQAVEERRQQEQAQLSRESGARAEEDAARKRAQDADPIKGTDDKANADRLLLKYVDGILDGTATPAARRLYAEAAQYYLKPQMQWIDDPTDPTKKQMVPVSGQLPEGFPHPSFKPGEQQAQTPAAAAKTDFKPLPETERKLLIDTATRIDQETQQRNLFKPEYAGFGNAAIGEFANAVARNNPIASKADTARAEWWQNYQRYKLAVRQGISGQSLTESELAEFDKADIHPGMTAQAVRDNLLQQDKVLRTAHERRVGSLAFDRFNPDAIRAASGVDPSKVTVKPLTESGASKPDTGPHPPGYKVVIP